MEPKAYQYFITNFEPWSIDDKIGEFDRSSVFSASLEDAKLPLNKENYLQMMKVLDLQAFGNSIIEMMVGQSQEQIVMDDKDVIKNIQ